LPKHLDGVVLVDQSTLGKTPRSNPAVYIGAFEDIREVYAQSDQAKRRGLNASAFSFNSGQGQCERCRGAGFEKIEMQFLSDIYIRCPECDGRRYRPHILEIKLESSSTEQLLSIADLLDSTVDEAVDFLQSFPESRHATRAATNLKLLQETGLGYLKLGQPINTLSGGESQRLKLVKHLAESLAPEQSPASGPLRPASRTLFLFDEPTTGLHFDDVRVLLKVFQRLVDAGHSVIVIEHNLDVIKSCDWVIDLGPEAGDLGGQLVAEGTPEQVADVERSYTGQALKHVLSAGETPRGGKKSRSRRVPHARYAS
jgi:excinuclease ABC subunit A